MQTRQTDVLNSCKIIDDLHATLRKEGYIFSREGLYLRSIPRSVDSQEGKLHVWTVPLKLREAKNILCNRHAHADFTFAIERQKRDIISLFGSDNVFVFSVDDKAKVPIGVTVVTKQCMWAMKFDYQVMILRKPPSTS